MEFLIFYSINLSVTAINGTTIEVKFNVSVKEDVAETSANYKINDAAIPGSTSTTYVLQDDKKTVKISLPFSNRLANDSTFLFSTSGLKTTAGSDVVDFKKIISFSDKAAPTLGAVSYTSNTTAVASFSEKLGGTAYVKVYNSDGADVTASNGTTVNTIITSNITSGSTDVSLDLSNAELNKVFTVKVFGAYDGYNNLAGTQTFTIVKTNADTTKPAVSELTVVDRNTFKLVFSEKIKTTTGGIEGTVSIDGGNATALVDDSNAVTSVPKDVTLADDGKTLTVDLGASLTEALHTISVNGVKDTSGNTQTDAFVKTVKFTADTTAPVVKSTSVADNYLYITFDDSDIALGNATNALTSITRVKDSVEYSVNAFGTAALYDVDGDTKTDTIRISLSGKDEGAYSATLAAATVKDKADSANNNLSTTISFNYTTSVASDKPKVVDADSDALTGIDSASYTAQSSSNPNTITIVFDREVTTSALDATNYTIDGVTAFEKATFVGDKKTVRLTLKDNAILVSDVRQIFTVKNVVSTAGATMDAVNFVQSFKEVVKPTVKSAALASASSVTVTFTENVTVSANAFKLYVNGVETEVTNSAVSSAAGTVTVTISTALTNVSNPITIKVISDATIKDANGNALTTGLTTPVTN